jgi:hypothetical protein
MVFLLPNIRFTLSEVILCPIYANSIAIVLRLLNHPKRIFKELVFYNKQNSKLFHYF